MKYGYEEMPTIINRAESEVKHHLWSLYWIARLVDAKTIVELGVRSGNSTRAFMAAAKDLGCRVVSFDIAGDAYHVRQVTESIGIPWQDGIWECRTSDSVEAGKNWSEGHIDMAFIDTSHEYNHTLNEILAWAPHIAPGGAMMFHDTGLNEPPDRDGVRPAMNTFMSDHSNGQWTLEDHPHIAEGDTGLGILWRHCE